MHLSDVASRETLADQNVLKQWFLMLWPVSMKHFVAKFSLNDELGRKVTRPKRYLRKRYCVLTQMQSRYTCHSLPLYKVPIKQEHRHTTSRIRSLLSGTHCNVGFTLLLHTCVTVRDNPTLRIYCWQPRLKLVMKIPPQVMSRPDTTIRPSWDWSCT